MRGAKQKNIILGPSVRLGGGGTLIFSYICRLWLFSAIFGGFKILNFNHFWGFQKTEYF